MPRKQGAVPRARLFALLDSHGPQPLTWISAPPGAGKTTLVASYLERNGCNVLWYRADSGDMDLATVFHHLREAAIHMDPQAAATLAPLTPEYLLDVPTFARNFFRALFATCGTPAALVIDNYQDARDGVLDAVLSAAVKELPHGTRVLVLSRARPPPALAATLMQEGMASLEWQQLRLTLPEARSMADSAGLDDPALLTALHARCDGWAAGLALLLQHARQRQLAPGALSPYSREVLFAYFAATLFDASPASTRHLLLCSALLPSFTIEQMAAFATEAEARQVVDWLWQRNFFIDCHEGQVRSFHYHALFRDFLLERGRSQYSTAERHALLLQAAGVADESGQPEAAMDLLLEAGAWDAAAGLICAKAPELLQKGRGNTLGGWIAALPAQKLDEIAWVRYWLGVARLPFDPKLGRACLEQAYAQFESQGDRIGCVLACSGILQSFQLEWADQKPMDKWFDLIRQLLQSPDMVLPPALETRVLPALSSVLFRHTNHPFVEACAARAQVLMNSITDSTERASLAGFLLMHFLFAGHWGRGVHLLHELRESIDEASLPPLHRIQLGVMRLAWCAFCPGDFPRAAGEEELRRFVEISGQSGIRVLDTLGFGMGAYLALNYRDIELAESMSTQMSAPHLGHAPLHLGHRAAVMGDIALFRGDLAGATKHAEFSMQCCVANGSTLGIIGTRVLLAQIHAERGDFNLALREADELVAACAESRLLGFAQTGYMLRAYVLLRSGQEPAGLAALRQALELGRTIHQTATFPWMLAKIPGFLYSIALRDGIEVPYVRGLIRLLNLRPGLADSAEWPWHVRVHTLGRFRVLVDEAPLRFSAKAQKKPLELLKALIALGGKGVREERLAELLWPDAQADAAARALSSTLHRLRKLIGEKCIERQDGVLTLDSQQCRVDLWMLERLLTELALACRRGDAEAVAAGAEDLLLAYRHGFLESETESPWVLRVREQLQAKVLRNLDASARCLVAAGRLELALSCYQRGVEIDPLAEPFHRGLIRAYLQYDRHAEALQAYDRCRRSLEAGLGVAPSTETEVLVRSVSNR